MEGKSKSCSLSCLGRVSQSQESKELRGLLREGQSHQAGKEQKILTRTTNQQKQMNKSFFLFQSPCREGKHDFVEYGCRMEEPPDCCAG